MQWNADYDVGGPVEEESTLSKALIAPAASSSLQVEIGPLARKLFTVFLPPDTNIKRGDVIEWNDTNTRLIVDNEPMVYYDPSQFPSLVAHHVECLAVEEQ